MSAGSLAPSRLIDANRLGLWYADPDRQKRSSNASAI